MTERYNFSLTTFSPSGKLVQIEYALNAVQGGSTSVGIKATNGIVIATEKKLSSSLIDVSSVQKISKINHSNGFVYSGLGADARVLTRKSRKIAQAYYNVYKEHMTVSENVREIASVMQEFTQSGGVRPFGVSLLMAGFDEEKPKLYQIDPSGAFFPWKASAIGKNFINAKSFLEKRYNENLELQDAIHIAILALKEGFEGTITEHNIEVAIASNKTFKQLLPEEIKTFLIAM